MWDDDVSKHWLEFKQYKDKHYQNVQVVSINPVLLKGVFDSVAHFDTFAKADKYRKDAEA